MSIDLKADYPEISNVAQRFTGEAERIKQIAHQLGRGTEGLRHGWTGRGAQRFQQEMAASILPEFQRLAGALTQSGAALKNIEQIFQTAEEEAARLLQMQARGIESEASGMTQASFSRSGTGSKENFDSLPPGSPQPQSDEASAESYGITFIGHFTDEEKAAILRQVQMTASRLHKAYYAAHPDEKHQKSEAEFFKAVFGEVPFKRVGDESKDRPRCAAGRPIPKPPANAIYLYGNFDPSLAINDGTIIHELGHYFDYRIGGFGEADKLGPVGDAGRLLYDYGIDGVEKGKENGGWARQYAGYGEFEQPYLQHPIETVGGGNPGEDFADMFMNWVRDPRDPHSHCNFAKNLAGLARGNWMSEHMPEWISKSISNRESS